ncbi:tRNA pseudouridine(55) synthase TruB [Smaragdicoccus niigatensis]|uniref:tRNA pseudouridine(55) synthase TruB n=1 Tax=Smaragdicoccus niigatensis TaxID=359359 RepID=UPI0003675203|nr:tRNA pseudouridine(55) synthase TruB [Smaragdicoccus niigatensis]
MILGGLLIVDKPAGMTSHDVVSRCRRIMKTRKIGHAGTLDPMATGVLVLGVERATKLLGLLSLTTKSYAATIRLGQATTTDDAEGEVISSADVSAVEDADIKAQIAVLTGDIMQVPATVSAIKIDGKRAYALARAGEDVVIPARPVTVSRFEVIESRRGQFIDLDVVVDCSSGTYIRSLARDLGAALGVGGHLTALRRTVVGPFGLDVARTLDELADDPTPSLEIDDAIRQAFPVAAIEPTHVDDISHGRPIPKHDFEGVYGVADENGEVIALVENRGKSARTVFVVRPA